VNLLILRKGKLLTRLMLAGLLLGWHSALAVELIVNGNMESTDGWTVYPFSQSSVVRTTDVHRNAQSCMLLQWVEASDRGVPGVKQDFTVPDGVAAFKVSFWFKTANANTGLQFRLREKAGNWFYNGLAWEKAGETINYAARTGWFQGDTGTASYYHSFSSMAPTADWVQYNAVIPAKSGIRDYTVDFISRGNNAGFPHAVYVTDISVQPVLLVEDLTLSQNPYNPQKGKLVVSYAVAQASAAQLCIYNLAGSLVWQSNNLQNVIGTCQAEWDGKDSRGRIVAKGVYVVVVKGVSSQLGALMKRKMLSVIY
jgi:hypothetical protein